MAFAAELRRLHQAAGKPSYRRLAARSGLGPSTIGELLNGKFVRAPAWENVRALIDACRLESARDDGAVPPEVLRFGDTKWWRRRHGELVASLDAAQVSTEARHVRQDRAVPFAPLPPAHAIPRVRVTAELVAFITGASSARTTAVVGPPGNGKTVLVQQVATEPAVLNEFTDGVLWVSAGADQSPADQLSSMRDALTRMVGQPFTLQTLDQLASQLRLVLAGKSVLVVIDNVWHSWQLTPWLDALAPDTRLILTTRDMSLAPADSASLVLEPMSDEEIRRVILDVPESQSATTVDSVTAQLVARADGSPLVATLLRSALASAVRSGANSTEAADLVLRLLNEHGLASVDRANVYREVEVGLTVLLENYAFLPKAVSPIHLAASMTIFPPDTDIDPEMLQDLWGRVGGLTPSETKLFCRRLMDLFIVRTDYLVAGGVRMHDLVHEILHSLYSREIRQWHRALVDAWRPAGGWAEMAAENRYRWQRLTYHLAGAGYYEDLILLALDVKFLASQVLVSGAFQVEEDLEIAARVAPGSEQPSLTLRQERFARISHIVMLLETVEDVSEVLLNYVSCGIAAHRTGPIDHGLRCQPILPLPDNPHPAVRRVDRIGDEHTQIAYLVQRDRLVFCAEPSTGQLLFGSDPTLFPGLQKLIDAVDPSRTEVVRWRSLGDRRKETVLDTGLMYVKSLRPSDVSDEILASGDGRNVLISTDHEQVTNLGAFEVHTVHWTSRQAVVTKSARLLLMNLDDTSDARQMHIPWADGDVHRHIGNARFDKAAERLLIVSPSQQAALFRVDTLELLWVTDFVGPISYEDGPGMVFSADETLILLGGEWQSGGSLSAATGERLSSEGVPAGSSMGTMAVSPFGDIIAIQERESRSVLLYDTAGRRVLREFGPFSATVTALKFSPEGQHLVVGHFGGLLEVFDLATGETLLEANEHSALVQGISFTAPTTFVTWAADGTAIAWDLASPRMRGRRSGPAFDLAWDTANQHAAALFSDQALRLFSDVEEPAREIALPVAWDFQVPVAVNGDTVAVAFPSGQVLLIDCSSNQEDVFRASDSYLTQLLFAEKHRLMSVGTDNKVRCWSLADGVSEIWQAEAHNRGVSSPDAYATAVVESALLHVCGLDGTVRTYRLLDGELQREVPLLRGDLHIGDGLSSTRLHSATWRSLDGSSVLVGFAGMGNMAGVISVHGGATFRGPVHTGTCSAIEIIGSEPMIISGGTDGHVGALPVGSEVLRWVADVRAPVTFVAHSERRNLLAVGCLDGTVHILEAETGAPARTLGFISPVLKGAWLFDGAVLAMRGPRGAYLLRCNFPGESAV